MINTLTYNDLQAIGDNEAGRKEFIQQVIDEHESSPVYKQAVEADRYASGHNVLIEQYQKVLYTVTGQTVPDNYTANHKCKSGFFKRFVTQKASFLLGNGATFKEQREVKEKLGKKFDSNLYRLGKAALIQSVAFGFWNKDHLEIFKLYGGENQPNFAPLYDEKTGKLFGGVRCWKLDSDKPLNVTLYEPDGFTEYQENEYGELEIIQPKRGYKQTVRKYSGLQGQSDEVININYPILPIIPLYANEERQSTLVGLKEQIDCYDLIKSGFANDLDDASMIYWTLTNAGGMNDDVSLAKFIEHMKTVKAAVVDDEANIQSHTFDVPYQSREAYLSRLKKDLYEDAMALDTEQISAGNVTATQINAAYEPLNEITDEFEFCVLDFMADLAVLVGFEEEPVFKRSQMKNQAEETQMVLSAASELDEQTILEKLPFITNDEVPIILQRKSAEEIIRFNDTSEEVNG